MNAIYVFLMIFANRGLGYVRDILLTAALGTSTAAQLFVYGFRIFGSVRALFVETAIPALVVKDTVSYDGGSTTQTRQSYLQNTLPTWNIFLIICFIVLIPTIGGTMYGMLPVSAVSIGSSDIILAIASMSIGFAFYITSAVFSSVLQANERFGHYSIMNAIPNISFIMAFSFLYVGGSDLSSSTQFQIVSYSFGLFGIVQYCYGLFANKYPIRSLFKSYFRNYNWTMFSDASRAFVKIGPVSLFTVTSPVISLGVTWILGRNGENITHFFIAERIVQLIPGTVGYAISVVLLPKFAKSLSSDKTNIVFHNIFAMGLVGAMTTTLIYLYASDLVNIVYGNFGISAFDGTEISNIVRVICLVTFGLMIEPVLISAFFSRANPKDSLFLLIVNVVSMFVVVVVSYILLPNVFLGSNDIFIIYDLLVYSRLFSILLCFLILNKRQSGLEG